MSTLSEVEKLPIEPKPPRLGAYIAAILELFMLAIFVMYQSPTGILIWIAYFYYSATYSLIFREE